jgi:hypothetical protein
MINGAESALSARLRDAAERVRARYVTRPAGERVAVLVDLVRRAVDHVRYGHLIGKDCMSVVTTPRGGFDADYHPSNSSPIS